jgi:peptidoglycan/xylan/chitin deacetylase (PgdA/CDA1 family)
MLDWKTVVRPCYYAATLPYRWWARRVAEAAGRAPVVVLAYHRVADDRANPWTISNRMFARHVDWLAERFDVISLVEAQRRLRIGDNSRTAVCITFDDGYAENCHQAIPLLIRRRIPCAYFVTLANVLDGSAFGHDVALGKPLLPNSVEQLRAMAGAGIEIGSHCYEHVDLGRVTDRHDLERQVVTARERLQKLVGCPVRYLAFPFGRYVHLSPRAMDMAYEAGYEGVCSAYGGYNFPGDEPFHLQRTPIDDSLWHLKNCASVDPRKIHVRRFLWEPDYSRVVQAMWMRG